MTNEELQYIISTKKRHRTMRDKWDLLAFLPQIVFGLLGALVLVSSVRSNGTSPFLYWVISGIFCFSSIFAIRFTYKRLKEHLTFTSIPTDLSRAGNYKAIVHIYSAQEAQALQQFPDYLEYKHDLWSVITVIPLDKEILVNSTQNSKPLTLVGVKNIEALRQELAKYQA